MTFRPRGIVRRLRVVLRLPSAGQIRVMSYRRVVFRCFTLVSTLLSCFQNIAIRVLIGFFFTYCVHLYQLVFYRRRVSGLFRTTIYTPMPIGTVIPGMGDTNVIHVRDSLTSGKLDCFREVLLVGGGILRHAIFSTSARPRDLYHRRGVFRLPAVFCAA